MKYSDQVVDWLVEEGYTHCFYVAGGNIMHILNSVRTRMTCVPTVHEVAAGIATEYFNVTSPSGRAFTLVTAGPGLTNVVTAMAGAYLESRELLVIGGQVKSTDLATEGLRQRGIQEIDGMALAEPVTVARLQLREPQPRQVVLATVGRGSTPRRGPVFIEFCLDAQAAAALDPDSPRANPGPETFVDLKRAGDFEVARVVTLAQRAKRPLLLVGGGLDRDAFRRELKALERLGIPIATTWNGADLLWADHPLYFGRPNTWGMRWANILLQQADLIIALGTRLGLQQTGFNWQAFAPAGDVVHVDVDPTELSKGHPMTTLAVAGDAADFLNRWATSMLTETTTASDTWAEWRAFGREVRTALPNSDPGNNHAPHFLDPYEFVEDLGTHLAEDDIIIPCSSGGAFTVTMQALQQRKGQRIVTDKGLASMGYGLSGAIGAAVANPGRRTILIEGDGGFAQNVQELGTVVAQNLNLKIFLFVNDGYASIRMTQRNYFDGAYLGCDADTGLGFPNWQGLFQAYNIPTTELTAKAGIDERSIAAMTQPGPHAFIVPIDPEQTYYPKINSHVTPTGSMASNPLHHMHPPLNAEQSARLLRYLPDTSASSSS